VATVNDLIEASLREINVLAAGEVMPAEDAIDGLAALNRLRDKWAAERLMIYTTTRTTWTIVASTGQYTVGTGGDVNIVRPNFLDRVGYIDTAQSPDLERILPRHTEASYAGIEQKEDDSTYPTSWYYNPTFTSSLGTLDFFPVPTGSTLEGVLYSPTAIATLAGTDTVTLPPGYEQMIVKTLALELVPSYGKQPHPMLVQQAQDAMAVVKRSNERMRDLRIDSGALIGAGAHGYDIREG